MARSRRRATKRRRERGDWVYRGGTTDETGTADYFDASYAGVYQALSSSGTSSVSAALILYDSHDWFTVMGGGLGNALSGGVMSKAARAEGRKAKMLRVQGQFSVQASTWTLGNEVRFGLRIGIFQQDPEDGGILVPAAYRMMTEPGVDQIVQGTSVWADHRRMNQWEHRHYLHFATGNEQSLRTLRINTPIRGSLNANECLALYMENAPGGVALRFQSWLRTYVVDES